MAEDKAFAISFKSLQQRFAGVDVSEQSQALKLVYDVDVASSRKDHAFMIFNGCLASVPEMPEVLASCQLLMKTLEEKSDKEHWLKVAELTRADAREATKMQSSALNRVVAEATAGLRSKTRMINDFKEGSATTEQKAKHAKWVREKARLEKSLKQANADLQGLRLQSLALEEGAPFSEEEIMHAKAQVQTLSAGLSTSAVQPASSQVVWSRVVKAILRKVMKLGNDDDDHRLRREIKNLCNQRLNSCVLSTSPLQFAQDLQAEILIYKWVLKLMAVPGQEPSSRKFEYRAQDRFFRGGDMRGFNIPLLDEKDAEGCMSDIVTRLKRDAKIMGAEAHEHVAAISRIKQSRPTSLFARPARLERTRK